eukprot:Hpha_TRINITY_DN16374_c4_g6::TRINITY_DN16374_c4_g6_i1::g.61981::m.61981
MPDSPFGERKAGVAKVASGGTLYGGRSGLDDMLEEVRRVRLAAQHRRNRPADTEQPVHAASAAVKAAVGTRSLTTLLRGHLSGLVSGGTEKAACPVPRNTLNMIMQDSVPCSEIPAAAQSAVHPMQSSAVSAGTTEVLTTHDTPHHPKHRDPDEEEAEKLRKELSRLGEKLGLTQQQRYVTEDKPQAEEQRSARLEEELKEERREHQAAKK